MTRRNCENCGRTIGPLEEVYSYYRYVVCKSCKANLENPFQSSNCTHDDIETVRLITDEHIITDSDTNPKKPVTEKQTDIEPSDTALVPQQNAPEAHSVNDASTHNERLEDHADITSSPMDVDFAIRADESDRKPKLSYLIHSIIAVVIFVLTIVTLPGQFRYWYRAGKNQVLDEMHMSQDLRLGSTDEISGAASMAQTKSEGLKCALLMTAGLHIPLFLFMLITNGLLIRFISRNTRTFLRMAFLGNWVGGALLLSLGMGYWSKAISFPESLVPALVIYTVIGMFFLSVLGLVRFYRST